MDRLEKIKNVAETKREKERQEVLKASQERENLFNKVRSLLPRVQELCKLIRELDKNQLLKTHDDSRDYGKDFFTDGLTHKIGFSYVWNLPTWLNIGYEHYGLFSWNEKNNQGSPRIGAIGSQGGGGCYYNVALTEDGKLLYNGGEYACAMEWLVKGFDNFEKRVFDFIDNLEE